MVVGRAGAPEVADRAGFGFFDFGLGMTTRIVGSSVPPDCSPVGAVGVGVGVSLAAGDGDAGAAAAGASLPGDGAVCAKAPEQSEEIRKDVEASNRGHSDIEAFC